MQSAGTISKALTKTISFEIQKASLYNVGELCNLTANCLDIAQGLNFPASFADIQGFLIDSDYTILITQDGETKGFACFSTCKVQESPALYLHIILLRKDIQQKGVCIRLLNAITRLVGSEYLITQQSPLSYNLDNLLARLNHFHEVHEEYTLPLSTAFYENDAAHTIVFKRC